MKERVTFISLFEEEDMSKIMRYISRINDKTCKVPYGKNADSREEVDTLPYHFTLYSFPISQKNRVKRDLEKLVLPEIKIQVVGVEIMNGACPNRVIFL